MQSLIFRYLSFWLKQLADYLAELSGWWRKYAFIAGLIKCSRVTVFILAFAALFLLMKNSQGQELTIRLSDSLLHSIVFLTGVLIWAFQSWFGTRKVLEAIAPQPNAPASRIGFRDLLLFIRNFWLSMKGQKWSVRCEIVRDGLAKALRNEDAVIAHWPRVLGILVFVISVAALALPVLNDRIALFSWHGLLILADLWLAWTFYMLVLNRRLWAGQSVSDRGAVLRMLHPLTDLGNLQKVVWGLAIFYVILLVLATVAPVWLGFVFGAAGIAVLGFGSLTAFGNFIIRSIVIPDGNKNYGAATQFPVLSVLFIIAVVFSFFNDNHEIRLLKGEPLARPELKQFAVQWGERNQIGARAVRPMVFVATAGGGIRASQWTSAVLTHLTDNNPKFAESLFAISGVSGGSVGAAFYSSLLKQKIDCAANAGKDCLQERARHMLSHDFLGPTVSALLFNDLLQRFLPFGILPDRQKALESGWEKAWSMAFGGAAMSEPYSSTWSKPGSADKWLPLLLLNSTHMETGRKVITSPFPLAPKQPEFSGFLDDVDLIQLLGGRDMPLSAAAGNSARFTYVSPPGTLPYDGGWFDIREDNGHLLDGGYFENNGANTLHELLKTLENLKADDGSFFFERYAIKPIVVLITNDNQLVCDKDANGLVACPDKIWIEPQQNIADATPAVTDFNGKFTRMTDNNGANETLGPILGILNSRGGHGIAGAKSLIAWVNECQRWPERCHLSESARPEFFHFRIDLNKGENPPALGWVLSKDSEKLIWNKIKAPNGKNGSKHNSEEATKLLELL